jgi:hypothetical protein
MNTLKIFFILTYFYLILLLLLHKKMKADSIKIYLMISKNRTFLLINKNYIIVLNFQI